MKKIYAIFIACALSYAAFAQCTVSFTYSASGLTISATATGTGATNFPIYGWDWGDQQIGTGQTANHTYAAGGTYQVCAYYFDGQDTTCNAVSCQAITVQPTGITEITPSVSNITASPNPFTSKLTIDYSLAQGGDVEISVYDLTGKKVAIVAKDKMNPGHYELVWTPENLSAGIYFVQMNINGQIYTKKLVHTIN